MRLVSGGRGRDGGGEVLIIFFFLFSLPLLFACPLFEICEFSCFEVGLGDGKE